jgi:uncharacterized protein
LRSHKRVKRIRKLIWRFFGLCFLLIVSALLYAKFIEPNWIEINSMELTLPHLAAEFNGYRIVQISDIHTDRSTTHKRLTHIFSLVNQQKPDLVAMTGDFITGGSEKFLPKFEATLNQIQAKDKIVAVLGNHDYWADPKPISQALTQNGILNLGNEVYTLQRGNSKLHIAGVDDIFMGKQRLDLVLSKLTDNSAAILLAHEPDYADTSAATKRFDLELSGHSHAGQIRLPFFKPPILPELGRKYYSGLYQVGEMMHYTNRGIGTTGLHLRFGSRPEITVFTLKALHN